MRIEAFIYYFWLPSGTWEPPYTANMKARVFTRALLYLFIQTVGLPP